MDDGLVRAGTLKQGGEVWSVLEAGGNGMEGWDWDAVTSGDGWD